MGKKIPLSQGKYALVDDEDFEWLNQWKWYAHYNPRIDNYYVDRNEHVGYDNGKHVTKGFSMHRTIMGRIIGRELKKNEFVDHINHDVLNNTRNNLRIVSNRQNQHNQNRNASSQYPGVHWNKQANKWAASIQLSGKNQYMGLFGKEINAAKAYEMAQRLYLDENLVCKLDKEPSYKITQNFTPIWKLKTTASKYKGVCWHKQRKKWRARIQINGKRKSLGLFSDERKAARAYERTLRKHCGEKLVCKMGE